MNGSQGNLKLESVQSANLRIGINRKRSEVWKDFLCRRGVFQISNLGRIRDAFTYKIYSDLRVNSSGYLYFFGNPVHWLVLQTFVGECPEGYECNHKDQNRINNSVSNLEWIPRHENRSHKGSTNGSAKLKEGEVWLIKKILSSNVVGRTKLVTHSMLANMFKVHRRTIRRIMEGEKWKHVTI